MSTNEFDKERNNEAWRRVGVVATIGGAVVNLIRIFVRN